MATFTVATATTFRALTGRAGADTYTVNGGTLTIDSDTRYNENSTASTGNLGGVTISSTLGGSVIIDATRVRAVPFSTGAGVVPAAGTTITQGGTTASLLCVMSSRTGGTVAAPGAAMPLTGYIKVRDMAGGVFASGVLTGITAVASGADEVSFIEVLGVEAQKLVVPRLGLLRTLGAMFEVGTTSGARHQTLQLPAYVANTWHPGVWVETAASSGVFKFWANGYSRWATTNLSSDSRCRMVYIDGTGLCRIGGDGTSAIGDLPVSGCRVRVPNIVLSSTNSTVGYAANAAPSTTLSTRYAITATNGVFDLNYLSSAWNGDFQSPYQLNATYCAFLDRVQLVKLAAASTITQLHTGLGPAAYDGIAFLLQGCLNGGTLTDCSGTRAVAGGAGAYATNFVNSSGWTINTFRAHFSVVRAASSATLYFNTCANTTVNTLELVGDLLDCNALTNCTITNIVYADVPTGSTSTSLPVKGVTLRGSTAGCLFDGMTLWPGVVNVHPYTSFLSINTVLNSRVRNFGTAAAPLTGGSANATGIGVQDTGNCDTVNIQRMWFSNLRTQTFNAVTGSTRMTWENIYGAEAQQSTMQSLNSIIRGHRGNATNVTNYTGVFGTHFWDGFISDTSARAALVFSEKTNDPLTSSGYAVTAGAPTFLADGSLKMAAAGDQIVWTWGWPLLGWSALSTVTAAATNLGNHTLEFDVDAGGGYTGYRTLNATNLAATSVAPAGFTLRVRITCNTASSTNLLTALAIDGATTLAQQNAATRALDSYSVTLTGLQPNSEVRAYAGTDPLTAVEIAGVELSGAGFTFTHASAGVAGYIQVIALGYNALQVPITYSSSDVSFPIQQNLDRNFLNP